MINQLIILKKIQIIKGLDLEQIIKEKQPLHLKIIDRYYYVIHKILTDSLRKKDDSNISRLNQNLLRENLGCKIALDILNNLAAWGIIIKHKGYLKKICSQGYEINKKYFKDGIDLTDYIPKEFKVCSLLNRKRSRKNQLNNYLFACLSQVSFDMDKLINKVFSIDDENCSPTDKLKLISFLCIRSGKYKDRISSAENIEDIKTILNDFIKNASLKDGLMELCFSYMGEASKQKLLSYFRNPEMNYPENYSHKALSCHYSLAKILDKEYYLEESKKTGRHYTNYCNLKRELRGALIKNDGQKLVEADIKSCQPFFLGLLVKKLYDGMELPENVKTYIELTTTGKFYDYMETLPEFEGSERKNTKDIICIYILFCKNIVSYNSKYFLAFQKKFPDVASFILRQRKGDYRKFSHLLQRLESNFMIKYMGNEFMKEDLLYITIHDSGIMEPKSIELFKEKTDLYFKDYGIKPLLKINELGKDN